MCIATSSRRRWCRPSLFIIRLSAETALTTCVHVLTTPTTGIQGCTEGQVSTLRPGSLWATTLVHPAEQSATRETRRPRPGTQSGAEFELSDDTHAKSFWKQLTVKQARLLAENSGWTRFVQLPPAVLGSEPCRRCDAKVQTRLIGLISGRRSSIGMCDTSIVSHTRIKVPAMRRNALHPSPTSPCRCSSVMAD